MAKTTTPSTETKDTAAAQNSALITPNSSLTLTLKWESVSAEYQKVLRRLSLQVKSPGFRKGKVPTKIAEEVIGRERLIEESLQKLLPPAYEAALKDSSFRPITTPEFSPIAIAQGADWQIKAEFAELPTISLKDYKKVVKNAHKAAEKEHAEHKKAEEKDKKAEKSEIKQTPEETEAEKAHDRDHMLNHLFHALVMELRPQVQELLIKQETQAELEQLLRTLSQLNMTLDAYLERRGIDRTVLSQELAAHALSRLQMDFVLGAIAREEKLAASPEEIEAKIAEIEDEKLKLAVKSDQHYAQQLEATIIKQKVVDHLLALK